MSENVNGKAPKKNWFKGLKAEFNKIIWPDKKTVAKETTAVVVVTVILGLVISLLDFIITHGVNLLVNL
jgi:preprotein translocase subunit SecE